jgi:putative sigma-54 modulation protein
MLFEIYGKDIRITGQLRGHIERRLCFALERFAKRIRRVRVSIRDLNGPRGGIDKCCQVAVVLAPSTIILLEDRDPSLFVAIDRVADKAGMCIGRRLNRQKDDGKWTRISQLLR